MPGRPTGFPRFARYANSWLERLQERVEATVQVPRIVLMILAATIIGSAAFVMVNITTLVQ